MIGRLATPCGAPKECTWEFLYNVEVQPWLFALPSIQLISNPGGTDKGVRVYALRIVASWPE